MLQLIQQHLLCSASFIAIYALLLQKQKTFVFNRSYLLSSLVLTVIIPFINIPLPVLKATIETIDNPVFVTFTEEFTNTILQPAATSVNWQYWLLMGVYFIGFALFLAKLIYCIYTINQQKQNAIIQTFQKAQLVLTEKTIVPHSFLNTIYLNKTEFEQKDFATSILTHEYAHIQQKHSLDILLIEFLQVVLWFNPLTRLFKKAIKLNHEFLADEAVVTSNHDIKQYQYLLLNLPKHSLSTMAISSHMNFITTKKRFMMMTKKQNRFKAIAAKALTLVLTLSIAAVITVKLIAQEPKKEAKPIPIPKVGKDYKISKDGFKPLDFTYKVIPEGTTNSLLLEYQQIVNEAASYKLDGKDTVFYLSVPYEKRKRVDYIYSKLTKEERKQTDLLTMMMSFGPPKKESPTETQFENFKNDKVYGVWVDGKKVPNEKLSDYKATDFVYFFASKLYGAAKKGRSYSVQVDLSTAAYYKETWKEKKETREFIFRPEHEKKNWHHVIRLDQGK